MNIWLVVAGLILFIIGGLIGVIILTTQPTRGNKIAQYEFPQQALLVIDLQEDYTGTTAQPPFPYKESEKLIATVNTIIEELQKGYMLRDRLLRPTRVIVARAVDEAEGVQRNEPEEEDASSDEGGTGD